MAKTKTRKTKSGRKLPATFNPDSRMCKLSDWLDTHKAVPLWTTFAPVGEVRAYLAKGQLVLVLVYAENQGFELLMSPTSNHTIKACFDAADRLLSK